MPAGRNFIFCIIVGLVVSALHSHAQELSATAGVMGTGLLPTTSYAWQLEYRHPLVASRYAWSASWLNEGHSDSHHRDGLVLQAWAAPIHDPDDFSLAVGVGAYRYADTRFWPGDGYTNAHGWAPIVSLSATLYTDSPLFFRVTGNHVPERDDFSTNTVTAGVGYQLGWKAREESRRPRRAAQMLTAMVGRTIVNSRSSEQAAAAVVEYRRSLGAHWDWTASWLYEGDPRVVRRKGAATQIWITDAFPRPDVTIGLGVGPYFVFTRQSPRTTSTEKELHTAVVVTPTIACELGSSWQARLSWNRVLTHDNRDTDVIVMGLGVRWGRK